MSNVVFQRFLNAKQQSVVGQLNTEVPNDEAHQPTQPLSQPIDPEVLRTKLSEKLNPQPVIVVEEVPLGEMPKIELIHFSCIFEFVHWYENNKALFSEKQQAPLDSLIEARNITLGGCNCDRDKRTMIAEDYFRKFWTQNKNTDLLPTLQNLLKTKKVLFGDFLIYPE